MGGDGRGGTLANAWWASTQRRVLAPRPPPRAAAALLQPFEWQNIFIPVLSSSYLPYCCAPNPYLLGLTPAQFSQLCDEYGVGEVRCEGVRSEPPPSRAQAPAPTSTDSLPVITTPHTYHPTPTLPRTLQVVLVALDEGYVAALNNSMPLIDLEGATAANSSTGEMSYA